MGVEKLLTIGPTIPGIEFLYCINGEGELRSSIYTSLLDVDVMWASALSFSCIGFPTMMDYAL